MATTLLRRYAAVFCVCLALPSLCAPVLAAADVEPRTILFLAGPKDHGAPGRHEYERDLRVLAQSLESSGNVNGFRARVHVGSAPRELAAYDDVAAIVIHSSSDRLATETHPLFPPQPATDGRTYDSGTANYLKELNAVIKDRKIGVAVFHYANWAEHWVARGLYLEWLGGLWVQMGSRNPTDDWTMTPTDTKHPILHGVQPWTYRDEVFCRFFLPDDARRTSLLIGTPAKSPVGAQVAAWAYERADGGRGFVMGGVDFHDNMQLEDYRRFLLNGIVWIARGEVPPEGVSSTVSPAP